MTTPDRTDGPDFQVSWLGRRGCVGTICGCVAIVALTVKLIQVLW